jgi:hypothetical protein
LWGGINADGERKSKKNNEIYLLTKYIKGVLWGVACKMLIFYEPRRIKLGNTRHFVERNERIW